MEFTVVELTPVGESHWVSRVVGISSMFTFPTRNEAMGALVHFRPGIFNLDPIRFIEHFRFLDRSFAEIGADVLRDPARFMIAIKEYGGFRPSAIR